MMKKENIFLGLFAVVLIGGGFFYWWQDQKEVRDLNESLPKGVRVEKSLIGNEYKVVNRIEGYEFKIPMEWGGVQGLEHNPNWEERGYKGSTLNLEGREGFGRIIAVDRYESNDPNENLGSWAKDIFNAFDLVGDFTQDRVGAIDVVKTEEDAHLLGEYVYFFKNDRGSVYVVTGPAEQFIRYIIANGQW